MAFFIAYGFSGRLEKPLTLMEPKREISRVARTVKQNGNNSIPMGCGVGDALCERAERCVLRRKLLTMESRLISDLMNITLASLVDEQ